MSVGKALASLKSGRAVLATDQAGQSAVILSAHRVRTGWVAWAVRHSSGLLCAPMPAARADHLRLPPMVARNQVGATSRYTVSVDGRSGVSTGISAADRARTFRALAAEDTTPADLIRPGHVLPLCVRPGGLAENPALPEAAVELCVLAGLPPVALLATLVADDGELLRPSAVSELAGMHSLPVLRVSELLGVSVSADASAQLAARAVVQPPAVSAPRRIDGEVGSRARTSTISPTKGL
ncbi:3,4-dihydroxy-2-butanone-4-phosphate synthase [Amycolatopsis rubida]|uniref:3,4-dihydroxy-2-butanone-4-phosphate synthase n=1 Tax=Amycolatopsis rubida TaxID=112413 RepID=A0ABX0C0B2_9PSEU|nr:3,4-dihydroxy-2-butanone-4-phosphate synthase [Amycolatopsis sp. M39]MYW96185.1 3,4-dihydroxy-2-butanone-4-phosphate synthase [Amycolatopsis rubida]NEC61176.1 3,4-dihydroxy-2-butanone-4-phosphate synthase [Amycolatopsis rubida]OAP24299.1 3,4-dihydroxy-2-butanone 4-phosphate synthase [Amycolatopsis sp. M39]